mgnify:CR=1 FL=1|tara:strand:+ start:557 stop:769 length:213 start_codon:yes stop_codon:yes gene_type:complete
MFTSKLKSIRKDDLICFPIMPRQSLLQEFFHFSEIVKRLDKIRINRTQMLTPAQRIKTQKTLHDFFPAQK